MNGRQVRQLRRWLPLATGSVVVVLVVSLLAVRLAGRSDSTPAAARPSATPVATAPARATHPAPISASKTSATPRMTHASHSPDTHGPDARETPNLAPTVSARQTLTKLIADAPKGGVSIAALDTVTGKRYTAGATSGITEASVAKLMLLEALLLQHQQRGTKLSGQEQSELTSMIEHSDNDAADWVWAHLGGHDPIAALLPTLGLTKATHLDPTYYWGLSTSSATEQLTLLQNLVRAKPLGATSRSYALGLLHHVEDDQRWGVPEAADPHTTYAVKNGWLPVGTDDGLWAVNSDAIITVDGHRVLLSVMTQHSKTEDDGIDLVEKLAKAAATLVTDR